MRGDTSALPLALATVLGGAALFVMGFVIAAEVGSADAGAATTGGACYTEWNSNTCSAGYTAVSSGEWTGLLVWEAPGGGVASAGNVICAAPKSPTFSGVKFRSIAVNEAGYAPNHEPCAICCPSGGAVGGIGELPPMAGIGGSPGQNYAVAALLAFVAVVAFGAGGWYARRRWHG
jgi:hypothetical protein